MSRVKPRETISERIASAKSLRWLLARSGGRGTYHAFAMSDGAGTLPCWLRRESVCLQYGRPGFDPWVRKIHWRKEWQPTPVLLPGESHGGRTLVGYSPWDRKESDMTERLHFHFQQSSWFSRQNKENEEFRNLGLWKICLLL